jgi:hypothetical protein
MGFRNAQLFTQLLTSHTHRVGLQRLTRFLSGKEPIRGLTPAPVEAQQLQQLGGQHDLTRELALALADVDDHPLAINVSDLQIQRFLTAKSCAVVQGQQCTVLGVLIASSRAQTSSRLQTVGSLRRIFGLMIS